jgi:hypothetical protein
MAWLWAFPPRLIPVSLFIGEPFTTIVDYGMAVAIPAHSYIGMRSVLIDYVPDASYQKIAIAAVGGIAVVTAGALIKLNLTDVGITNGFKSLWKKPTDAAAKHA